MRLRSTRSWHSLPSALLAPLFAVAGCTGGQSGTESEGGKFDDPFKIQFGGFCGCALAGSGTAVRAELESADDCGLQATVREVLGRGPLAEGPLLAPGEVIGGVPLLPCAEGLSLTPGDEVLIVHVPGSEAGPGCPERLECSAGCPAPTVHGDGGIDAASINAYDRCALRCDADTADACAAHAGYARLHGQLLVAPWAATLRISSFEGEAASLPRSELKVLLDPVACEPTLYPDAGIRDLAANGDPSVATDVLPLDGGADGGVPGAPACEPP